MTVRRKDLRTGRSVWQARRAPPVATARLRRDIRCDVVVVGAGVSGALIAELLSGDGYDVVVVDRRGPFKGSTAVNTGLVLYEIDVPLIQLAGKIGEANAVRAWRRSFLSLHALVERTRALGVECGLCERPSVYLSGNVLDARRLRREAVARAAAGFHVDYLSRSELGDRFGIAGDGGLVGESSFEVDPRRLTAGFLNAAISRGARLYAPADVIAVDAGRRIVRATTADGPSIKCRHLVFATGYEAPRGIITDKHQLVSTYAIATKPQPRRLWPERCLVWEASRPYLYLRTTEDGRIIAGGEDEEVSDADARDELIAAKVARICAKLGRRVPGVDTEPDYRWAGTFGMTATGLPFIGRIPRMPNCWGVLGYGGNGTTYSRLAAEIIRAAIAGRTDSDAGLYEF